MSLGLILFLYVFGTIMGFVLGVTLTLTWVYNKLNATQQARAKVRVQDLYPKDRQ